MSDPTDYVYVPFPCELYEELVQKYPGRASVVIENVVADFLERQDSWVVESKSEGIWWSDLHLPSGTEFRTKYKGEYKFAALDGLYIEYEDETFDSPARLARRMRGNTSVNAWITLEVKRPGDRDWKLADELRKKR
jgi:hypothetical protein